MVPPFNKVKIEPKTIDYIFIRYANNSFAHSFLIHKSNIIYIYILINIIIESRNASFKKKSCKNV
jgi:hypothetical protein